MQSTLRNELHALAQPMAVLQCRLELGLLVGDEPALRDAVTGAVADLSSAVEVLNRLRLMVDGIEEEKTEA